MQSIPHCGSPAKAGAQLGRPRSWNSSPPAIVRQLDPGLRRGTADSQEVARRLLAWYDVHARRLPWRSPPGGPSPDPYAVWLSEIMLQQTTVAAVRAYHARFLARWPDVAALAAADEGEVMAAWAGLGYYARARNLIACAKAVVRDHDGRFPDTEATLLALPGIGRYTAAALAAIAFGRRAVVVDGNVERVVARLFAVETPLPSARPALRDLAGCITPATRAGDFAQGMMDVGATVCTPRRPACIICPLADVCAARAMGDPARYPVKLAKPPRPQRHGTAFWLERDGRVLLRRRPASGLLGGMLALPTGPWTPDDPGLTDAPIDTDWHDAGQVAHIFTHFALNLRVVTGTGDANGEWWPIDRLDEAGLPTLFAKAAARARQMEIA